MKIYTKILIGLAAGITLGLTLSYTGFGGWGSYLEPLGKAFINLIKMVVIPLVMASIMLGTASLGDIRKLGRIGLKTLLFYACFIVLAVSFGLFMANVFQPGSGISADKRDAIIAQVQEENGGLNKEVSAAIVVNEVAKSQADIVGRIKGTEESDKRDEAALALREQVKAALASKDFGVEDGKTPDTLAINGKTYSFLKNFRGKGEEILVQLQVTGRSIEDILMSIIPTNPIQAMAEGNMLAVILFSIMFGVALTMIGAGPRDRVIGALEGVNDAMVMMVNIIMKLAPYGVFAIITAVTATLGIEFLLSLLRYAVVCIAALVIYQIGFYGLAVRTLGGMNPIRFFKEMWPVMIMAFSTSSSNATLPLNMKVSHERLGVPKEVSSFALPLGATVNMDGTAIYQGISAMFIAQVFMQPLGLEQQLTVVLTASLASIGAAGVPGIGMVTLALVLHSVGLPAEGIALVLGVERILDMFRTVLNVTGDATAAVLVGKTEGGLAPVDSKK